MQATSGRRWGASATSARWAATRTRLATRASTTTRSPRNSERTRRTADTITPRSERPIRPSPHADEVVALLPGAEDDPAVFAQVFTGYDASDVVHPGSVQVEAALLDETPSGALRDRQLDARDEIDDP